MSAVHLTDSQWAVIQPLLPPAGRLRERFLHGIVGAARAPAPYPGARRYGRHGHARDSTASSQAVC
jgi:transposase